MDRVGKRSMFIIKLLSMVYQPAGGTTAVLAVENPSVIDEEPNWRRIWALSVALS